MNENIKKIIKERSKEKDFNQFTVNSIIEFVEDFTAIFDDSYYGTTDDLLDKIFNNLNEDIEVCKLEDRIMGRYYASTGTIQLDEKNINKSKIRENTIS